MCALAEFEGNFNNIHKDFNDCREDWTRIYDSLVPSEEKFPARYENNMSEFEKLLVVKALRPDKLIPQIQRFIINIFGQKFVEIPA